MASHEAPRIPTTAPRLWAVVVTYFPDLQHLRLLLARLHGQHASVVVVDNASSLPASFCSERVDLPHPAALHWIHNATNRGIGAAQNQGIEHALAEGADFVTLLDQDSLPHTDMLQHLLAAWQRLTDTGRSVFAVGPRLVDPTSEATVPFISYRHGLKQRSFTHGDEAEIECFSLLASGTTVHRSALETVGPLDESLFLEYVDVEWGARARARGLFSFGVPRASMQHRLGDARVHVAGRLYLPMHSALRHYYSFRNAVLMQKRSYVPLSWKLADLLRCLATAPLFVLFGGNAREQAKMILMGAWHGLVGRSGSLADVQAAKTR